MKVLLGGCGGMPPGNFEIYKISETTFAETWVNFFSKFCSMFFYHILHNNAESKIIYNRNIVCMLTTKHCLYFMVYFMLYNILITVCFKRIAVRKNNQFKMISVKQQNGIVSKLVSFNCYYSTSLFPFTPIHVSSNLYSL